MGDALGQAGREALGIDEPAEEKEEEKSLEQQRDEQRVERAEAKAAAEDKKPELDDINPEPSPEEAEEIRAQKKARIAQIMSRGILNERLQSVYDAGVPESRHGKFVRDDQGSIVRYSNLGYTFEYNEDSLGEHATADNRIRVGDVVLMTISKDDHEILKEVRLDGIKKKLGASRREYKDQVARGMDAETGVAGFDDSSTVIRESTQQKERGA